MSDQNSGSDSPARLFLAGGQMLFVAFGALVLVPILTGLNPSVALFGAGVGTLIFQFCTGRQIPVFLGSSFAFIAPIIYGTQIWGVAATLGGVVVAGGVYLVLGLVVRLRGTGFLYRLLPPIVVGPVIIVIGLGLAPVAVHMAMGRTGDGASQLFEPQQAMLISGVSLFMTLIVATMAKGVFRLVPILLGITCGYLLSLMLGMVDFSPVENSAWLTVPPFVAPEWNINAILFMIPVVLAPVIEHVGDLLAISSVTGKDYLQKPGLHRTLMGDGLATSFSALVGGPPNTTYSEVTGAVILTKSYNPLVMTWAAVIAVVLAFVGKLGALLLTVPVPVMGGIMLLLFGSIAAVGLNTLIKARVDLSLPRNLVIVSLVLVFGIGQLNIGGDSFRLEGVGLAALMAVLLNLLLPGRPRADSAEQRSS